MPLAAEPRQQSWPFSHVQADHKALFHPPLPTWKVDAINAIKLGVVDKIFLEWPVQTPDPSSVFPSQTPECKSYSLLWNVVGDSSPHGDSRPFFLDLHTSTLQLNWDAQLEADSHVPSWVRGVHAISFGGRGLIGASNTAIEGTYLGAAPDRQATIDHVPPALLDFNGQPPAGDVQQDTTSSLGLRLQPGQPCCCAMLWIAGNYALEMERLSDAEVADGMHKLLQAFPAISLPSGALGTPIVHRTTWGSDPLFLGSYSYIPTGSTADDFDRLAAPLMASEANEGIEGLRGGVLGAAETGAGGESRTGTPMGWHPVLLFCGEATSRDHYGTTAGAFLTGQREARRLLGSWGIAG